ncbi:MAG TPA: hypothetical protein VFT74_10950 [Isosphaeraceae bacterium]|nr:hypothetical protein [Isosphaeraceae bacterium]
MIARIFHEGQVYRIQAPEGSHVWHPSPEFMDQTPGVELESLLKIPRPDGTSQGIPMPLVVRAASEGRWGLKLLGVEPPAQADSPSDLGTSP